MKGFAHRKELHTGKNCTELHRVEKVVCTPQKAQRKRSGITAALSVSCSNSVVSVVRSQTLMLASRPAGVVCSLLLSSLNSHVFLPHPSSSFLPKPVDNSNVTEQ